MEEPLRFMDKQVRCTMLYYLRNDDILISAYACRTIKYYQIPFVFRIQSKLLLNIYIHLHFWIWKYLKLHPDFLGFGVNYPRAVMKYKMLHSAIKYSPDAPTFRDFSSSAIDDVNVSNYPIDICCDSLHDSSSALIQKVCIHNIISCIRFC